MTWVKRNLFFLIGTVVALALIGLGGYYLWSEMGQESSLVEQIKKEYSDLNDLLNKKPQPGKAGTPTDNVEAARQQAAKVRELVDRLKIHFRGIPQIPGGARFANQLDETIAQMHRAADQADVRVARNYYFTFQAEKNQLSIPPASAGPLAVNLSEIKAISDILIAARINQLNSIQREASSPYDTNAPDYLPPEIKTVSTPLAVMTPYAVSFDCFSGELAAVLSGLAASPHGFVVKTIEVGPAGPPGLAGGGAAGPAAMMAGGMQPGGPPPGVVPMGVPPPVAVPGRFGGPGGTGAPVPPRAGQKPVTLVNENLLRVDLLIEVVKLKK